VCRRVHEEAHGEGHDAEEHTDRQPKSPEKKPKPSISVHCAASPQEAPLLTSPLLSRMTRALNARHGLQQSQRHDVQRRATSVVGPALPVEVEQSASALPRVIQTSTRSAIAAASSTSMPKYLTVLSIFVYPLSHLVVGCRRSALASALAPSGHRRQFTHGRRVGEKFRVFSHTGDNRP